jgi:hypothetical protein
VLLEEGRRTDLQVALAARATVHMPRSTGTEADEEITQVLAGGNVQERTAPPGKDPATESYEEAATVALTPATLAMEPPPASGVTRKNVATVTSEEGGATKIRDMASDAESLGDTVAITPVEGRSSTGKFIAAGAAVLLLIALAVAGYFALRGPAQVISAAPPPEQTTPEAAAATVASAQEESRMTELEKKVAEIERRKAALEADAREAARRETERAGKAAAEATVGKPSAPAPPEPPAQQADACANILVLNAAGQPAARRRVALLVESGAPNEVRGGLTDGGGRWQYCGLKAGQKVLVRVFGAPRVVMATRAAILQPGSNQLAFKLDRMGAHPQASQGEPDQMEAPSRAFRPNKSPNPFRRRKRP